MKRAKRFWLLALALSLLLTCAACGNKAADSAPAGDETRQEQTAGSKKDDAAKTDTAKADGKQDESKTTDDKKSDGQKAADETKKAENETKKQEEEKKQEEPKQEAPKQEGDPDTGKDKYETDPVPEGKPAPVEPEDTTIDKSTTYTCTISITCETILDNWDAWDEWDKEAADAKKPLVPSNGVILGTTSVTFSEGESVFDVLQRVCRQNGIHMESSWTPMYNSAYVEGINNLYEFDVSQGSGWMYSVNGWFPNYGCSRYVLQDGDSIAWRYTCDYGDDVGGGYAAG